jgi:polyferredoxin
LFLRRPLEVDVIRDRNVLYRLLDDGRVENVYNVKILNKGEHAHRYVITVKGAGELSLDPSPARFDVASGEVYPASVRVRRPAYEPLGPQEIEFVVQAEDTPNLHATTKARFLAPTR